MNSKAFKVQWHRTNVSSLLSQENIVKKTVSEPSFLFTDNIRFSDDFWDFRHLDKVHNKNHLYKFDFSMIDSMIFRVLLKQLIIREIYLRDNRIPTTQKLVYNQLKKLIIYLVTEKFISSPSRISPEVIKEYIEINFKHTTLKTLQWFLTAFRKFLNELEFGGYKLDYKAFETIFNSINKKQLKYERAINKTPNIPKRLYNRIIECAIEDINNEQLIPIQRMVACMIVILTQTGMRGGELCLLEANRLKDISILKGVKRVPYLEFFTYKTTRIKKGSWTETVASNKTVYAYQTLESLTETARQESQTNYLFISLHSNGNNNKGKLYTYQTFERNLDVFFYRHQQELDFHLLSEYEKTQVHTKKINRFTAKISSYIKNDDIGESFYTINPHQFRVAVANILRENGVQLQWIRRHMNHLEEDMTKHYFREDSLIQETLLVRSSSDGLELETNPDKIKKEFKEELSEPELQKAYETINRFLKKKKFNIFKDLDNIIDVLKNNPLRETSVGICIKSMGTLCERQERLATLEKWYYIRPQIPNIASFDFTYKRFIDKAKIVEHNKKLYEQNVNFQRQYELESKALNKFYENCFSVEYEMLLSKLTEISKEQILSLYPHLTNLVSRIDEVKKEVENWIQILELKKL